MSREENIEIFRDTEKLCKTNPVLLKAWKDSSSKQKLILENEEIRAEKNIYEQPAKIIVSKKRTFEAAMAYEDKKVAVRSLQNDHPFTDGNKRIGVHYNTSFF